MITDEQIDELVRIITISPLTYAFGTREGRERVREWITPILAAERNRLLDECLGIGNTLIELLGNTNNEALIQVINEYKYRIEELRHE